MKVYCLPRTTLNLALLGFQAFLRRSSLRKQHPYFLISEDPRLVCCTWAGSLNRDWQFCQLWITIGGNNQMVGMATRGSVYNQVSARGSAWNSAWHDVIWLQDIGSSQTMNFCENFIQLQKYIIKLHNNYYYNSLWVGKATVVKGSKINMTQLHWSVSSISLSPWLVATVGCVSCPNKSSSSSNSFLESVVGRAVAKHGKSERITCVKQIMMKKKGLCFKQIKKNVCCHSELLLTGWKTNTKKPTRFIRKYVTIKKQAPQTLQHFEYV